MATPRVTLTSLDTLWFQVAGTVCNLACSHCFISCSPTNHTHEMMSLETIKSYLEEAKTLGVKEYYFTGGEPFLNPEMETILETTLRHGPASVLTNGLLLDPDRCTRLFALAEASEYSLDLRVSLDGYSVDSHDAIRGPGSFQRAVDGIQNLYSAGINPVLTVTEVYEENGSVEGKQRFLKLIADLGVSFPRLKVMPVFQIGAEAERGGAYDSWQRLSDSDSLEQGWDHLQCSSSRMVTHQGTWVCPILINEPGGRMGERLADSLGEYPLAFPACWTCHVFGVSCRT